MRGLAVLAVVVLALVVASLSAASPSVRFGIQDDAWLLFGPGSLTERAERLHRLGFDVVRVTLPWHEIERDRGEYEWLRFDEVLAALREAGVAPVVTLWGSPAWANGGASPSVAPLRGRDFQRFAGAAASRYRFVRSWVVWNEPNQRRWLLPTSPAVYVARLLNPGYRGIKAANPRAKVAGGVTAPRAALGGVSPVDFIRGMARAGALLDAYAHHPYPLAPTDSPLAGGCAHCETITMATLERLTSEVGRAFPAARIWLTEYGYQTNPPDRTLGVSPALQARYIGEAALRVSAAPKVDMLVHYLLRDEPELGRWQSGLESVSGRSKPALRATMFPIAQVSRQGRSIRVWGQVRPGAGAQRYILQRWRGGWRAVGGIATTSPRGYLERIVRGGKGTKLRLWYPAGGIGGTVLVVR